MIWAISFLQVLFLLLSPFMHVALGARLYALIGYIVSPSEQARAELEFPAKRILYLLGLILHIQLLFLLKLAHVPWPWATIVPMALLGIPCAKWPIKRSLFWFNLKPHLNFVVWFAVVLAMGLSLFSANNGIQVPWRNSYGDLAFHIGSITSFVLGDNFPPQYHIFSGFTLSYPFFVNLWSAAFWWVGPNFSITDFRFLAFIFAFQWTVLWCLVYYFLNGNRYWLLPWALLLGGGSYYVMGFNSGDNIGKNVPWTLFLTTIWAPQRSALPGICVALACLTLFHQAIALPSSDWQRKAKIGAATLLASMSLLMHAHILITTIFYCATVLAILGVRDLRRKGQSKINELIFAGICFLAPAVLALPWLLGKTHTAKVMFGWLTGDGMGALPPGEHIWKSFVMWMSCAPFLFAVVAVVWGMSRRHVYFGALAFLFLAANFVQLAIWDWDQLKVFLALYAIFLFIWSIQEDRYLFWVQFSCIFLMIPTLYEGAKIFAVGDNHTLFERKEVDRATIIASAYVEPHAIFAAAPNHTSPIGLTGRRLFLGYDGWLFSHGLDYGKRSEMNKDLKKLAHCKTEGEFKGTLGICPDYLLWTEAEKTYWKVQTPPADGFEKTELDYLYKFKG